MRKSDTLVIAAWSALVFGLGEGVVLNSARAFPALLAPYKTSAHVLWVAPVVDLALFSIIAAGWIVLLRLLRRWIDGSEQLISYGAFVFLGLFTVFETPKIIHPIGVALLSLGLTVAVCRRLHGHESQLSLLLRRRALWIPILIIAVAFGVFGYEKITEEWRFRRLAAAPSEAPNVLVIVMDTVRYDSFTRPVEDRLTPNLDRIAAMGVQFENAWPTTSWSLPSQASILTGIYPNEHGADWPKLRLSKGFPTLGEYFTQQGYVTGAFSGNSAWVTPEYLGRGFLRFDVYILEDLLRRTAHGRKIDRLLWEVGYHYAGRGKKAPTVNAQFLRFLDDYPDRPFFAYLLYMDVNRIFHDRWLNSGFRRKPPMREVFEAYERGLSWLDRHIGDLFEEMEHREILENTLVIITSDHGESFGAAETNDHDPVGHGTSLYPEQLQVPLFVIYPNTVAAGQRIASTVSLAQIPVTIAHLLGLERAPFPGVPLPLSPADELAQGSDNAAVLATLNYGNHRLQSVIVNDWMYIRNLNTSGDDEELFNLTTDPLARHDLSSTDPIPVPIREHLQRLLSQGMSGRPVVGRDQD